MLERCTRLLEQSGKHRHTTVFLTRADLAALVAVAKQVPDLVELAFLVEKTEEDARRRPLE